MKGYIPTIWSFDLENRLIRKSFEFERRVQTVIVTDLFGSSSYKRNRIVLYYGGKEEGGS